MFDLCCMSLFLSCLDITIPAPCFWGLLYICSNFLKWSHTWMSTTCICRKHSGLLGDLVGGTTLYIVYVCSQIPHAINEGNAVLSCMCISVAWDYLWVPNWDVWMCDVHVICNHESCSKALGNMLYLMHTMILSRLFGLSAIIRTDCEHPAQLLLHPGLEYPVFVSPALLLLLFWILATEFRLWLGTPVS